MGVMKCTVEAFKTCSNQGLTPTYSQKVGSMIKNPHVWKRAQADIGGMVGIGRLPEFEDSQSPPHVDAIVR